MKDSRPTLTPYDTDYGPCDQCYLTLCIYPQQNHPDEITAMLGIAPTSIRVAKEATPHPSSSGMVRKSPPSHWFLGSKEEVESKDLRHHIDWLLERLHGVEDRLGEVLNLPGVRARISCLWCSRWGHGGPALDPSHLAGLARLGVEFSLDIYFKEEEQED